MIGKVLGGRYEIVERLGSGGWAIVYRGRDTYLGRPVAVKVLRSQFAADEEFVRRFRREAQSAAALSHPNIVSIYDVGQDGDTHYIVLEYVDGVTLKERIEAEGPLPFGTTARIASQVLDALEHAHQNQIVHRDIKPHNVLLTRSGRVKVTDFGIARAAASSSTLTHTGTIVGSAHYLSPEQARGGHTGVQSDLYSTGIVLYEMIAGRVPFTGDSPIAVAIRHIQDAPPPVEAPPALYKIVQRAIEKDQRRRYQSAAEMQADLLAFLESGEVTEQLGARAVLAGRALQPALAAGGGGGAGAVVPPLPRPGRPSGRAVPIDDDPPDDPNETTRQIRPRRRLPVAGQGGKWWMWLALLLVMTLGFAVAAGIRAVGGWFEVPLVKVPDVRRRPVAQAQEILARSNLVGRIANQVPSERPPGEVLSQNPEEGTPVKEGRDIELVISAGRELVDVPDLTGKTVVEAQVLLEDKGLRLGQRSNKRYEPSVKADQIFDQSPRPGTQVASGSFVDVEVNSGRRPVIMPLLLGEMQEKAVRRLRDDYKLAPSVREGDDPRFAPGTVMDQDPPLGTQLLEGDPVTLTVRRLPGKEAALEVPVPDAVGGVRVVVRLTDQRGTRDVYDKFHPPKTVVRISFTWVGDSATYEVFTNGQRASGGTLK